MVALFVGIPLEMVHRWWRLLILYVAGVLAGSLAASMFDPKVIIYPILPLSFLCFFLNSQFIFLPFSSSNLSQHTPLLFSEKYVFH